MQIDSLRYFVKLAQAGSFYQAAKSTFISQQGMNRAISSLEKELGVKLLERDSHGVRLTSAGEIFLEHAKASLAEFDAGLRELFYQHAAANPNTNRLVLHMTYYVAQVSGSFGMRMRESSLLNYVEEPFERILEGALKSDGSELFICDLFGAHDIAVEFPGLIFEPLIGNRAGIIWRGDLPIETHRAIHREQLCNLPLTVDSHRDMKRFTAYVMEDYPLNNIRLETANHLRRIRFLEKDSGAASLYDSLGYTLIQANPRLADEDLHFAPFSTPRAISHIGVFYNKKARPDVRARHAIETLRDYLRRKYPDYLDAYPISL